MYKTILLAADGSENSVRAAEETLKFIGEETTVTLLNVLDPEDAKGEVLHNRASSDTRAKAESLLEGVIEVYKSNQIEYILKVEHGKASDTVVNAANSGNYDAVVVGTRGLNTLQEMVMGSVSHKVAKRADTTVIIVK